MATDSATVAEAVTETAQAAGAQAAAIVEGVTASAEAAVANAEARAEAAETVRDLVADAAVRDAIHAEVEEASDDIEELEQWRDAHETLHADLNNRLQTMEGRMAELETKLAAAPPVTIAAPLIPPSSEAPEVPETPAAIVVSPVSAVAAAPPVAAPVAKARRWI